MIFIMIYYYYLSRYNIPPSSRMKSKKKFDMIAGDDGSDESGEEKLLQCIMCNCMTIEEYLKRHIRYNHLISKEEIIDKLYNLHYPKNFVTVGTQTVGEHELRTTEDRVDDRHEEDEQELDQDVEEGEELDEDVEEEEETCGACETNESVISPKATCSSCQEIYHWACVELTSKPGNSWSCPRCLKETKKKSSGDDHSYSSRFVNETVTDGTNCHVNVEENKDRHSARLDGSHDKDETDDKDGFEDDHNYQKRDKKLKRSNAKKSVKLNKLEDLCDMSKGELKDLCHSEHVNPRGTREDLEERLRRHFQKNSGVAAREGESQLCEVTAGEAVCSICGLGHSLPARLELGPLYQHGRCVAHLHCLMFSSGLIQRGEEHQGIIGFLPADIQSELTRGSKLRCTFCSSVYATVGCCQKSCSKSYHLPCGIKYGAICEYYGNFDSYCPTHRTRRVPKNRPRSYVLTDLGLIPERVDIDHGFHPEKYRLKLKRQQRDKGKLSSNQSHRHEIESNKLNNGNKRRGESKKIRESDTSDEEETSKSKKKFKKIHIKEERKEAMEVGGGRRSGRRIVKKTPGSDIYRSAVDELKKILEKKELIKVDDTFSELAGTSRKKRNVTVKREEFDSDEDVNWVRPRARRKSPKSDDGDEDEPLTKFTHQKQKQKRPSKGIEEEESVESIKIFLKDSKKPRSICRMSDSSEDDLPYPKIKRKSKKTRRETSEEINRDMEMMTSDEGDNDSAVNIDQLIDDLENEDEGREEMLGREDESPTEEEGNLTDSSDFEITEKESSMDSETSLKSTGKQNTKKKKGVSFSDKVTEIYERRNSKFFNVDNILQKKSHKNTKEKEEHEILPSCYVSVHMEETKEEVEDTRDDDDVVLEPPDEVTEPNCSDDEGRKMIENSSDEEEPPPAHTESTDADFDRLFSPGEADHEGEQSKTKGMDPDSHQTGGEEKTDTSEEKDILNMAVEEAGIVNKEGDETKAQGEDKESATENDDPFSTSPFKLLFSTIGGFGNEEEDRNPSDTENLSTSVDPDEFLQKHFK